MTAYGQKTVLPDGLYCMYLRKSREDAEMELHGAGDTLLRHENTLMDLAKKLNINIGHIYREIVSGESIDARPEVQALIRDLEQHKWKGVLVVEVERLARGDTLDQGIIARAFSISGAKIITPLKIYDPLNDSDMEYFEFGLFMSRREYATINRRIQRGRVTSVMEGKWIFGDTPYGYKRVKLDRDKGYTLAYEESEYDAVSLMWRMYLYEGAGSYTISLRLKALGYKNRRGGDFSPNSIRDILHNIVYAGYVKFGERKEIREIVDGKVRKRRITNPDPIITKGLHPAYVTLEEFQLGQRIRQTRSVCAVNFSSGGELQNPLAGICKCKKCGRTMQRQIDGKSKKRKEPVYRLSCNTPDCPNISTNIKFVEEAIVDALNEWTRNYKLNLEAPAVAPDTFEADLERLKKEKETLEAQKGRLYDFLERGIYDEEIFIQRNVSLANRIDETQGFIDSLIKNHEQKLQAISREEFIERVKTVSEAYFAASSAAEKNALLKSVFKRIDYEKDEGGGDFETVFELEFYPVVDFD